MIQLAIIGTGSLIESALPVITKVKDINVCAIYARPHSKTKAENMAGQYDISKVYTDYGQLLCDKEINFVYVAVTNIAHYDMGKEALLAGKNVIMEKPFCVTASEAKELADIAISKHLYLFEAVTLLHSPNFAYIQDNLHHLGRIKLVQCNYSQYSSRYDRYLNNDVAATFDPKMAGGALYDINIYNINFVVALFGKPVHTSYFANRGYNGVDTSGIAVFSYNDFYAECVGAKDSDSPGHCTIQGENGWIRMNGTPNEFRNIEMHINGMDEVSCDLEIHSNRMTDEFLHFSKIFDEGDYDQMKHYLEISINVIDTINSMQ